MGIENQFQFRTGFKLSDPSESYTSELILLSMPAFFSDSCALQNNDINSCVYAAGNLQEEGVMVVGLRQQIKHTQNNQEDPVLTRYCDRTGLQGEPLFCRAAAGANGANKQTADLKLSPTRANGLPDRPLAHHAAVQKY